MKCIRCAHDCKYNDRRDGRCPRCRGEFAFEPRRGDKFSDAAFQGAIHAVSNEGAVRFGVEHVYYELCRRLRRKRPRPLVAGAIGLAFAAAAVTSAVLENPGVAAVLGAGALGCLLVALALAASVMAPLGRDQFSDLWRRFHHVHGAPAGLIVRRESPAKPAVESDIADYSFDRAIICDRARTVDVLLANNFHFENNCAVLSIGGYPPGPFETVRAMLKRNPKLEVYALHDASAEGCALPKRLAADEAWFKAHPRVVDLGLRPSHAKRFRGLWIAAPSAGALFTSDMPAAAAEWLARYALELAVIRPEQLLKRLYRAMTQPPSQERGDGSSNGSSSGTDGGAYVGSTGDAGLDDDAADTDAGVDAFG